MASLTGPVYVPAPNPVVPRYGLFQVATGPLDLPVNARSGGLQYEVATCNLPLCYEVECFDSHNVKTLTNTPTTVVGNPFVVYSAIQCSPVGLANWGESRLKGFLYEQLRAGEQATVERTFSTSACAQSPGLANNVPAAVNLGTAVDIIRGVAILEDWLYARYGLPGVIHAPALSAAYFNNAMVVEKDSRGIWRTGMTTAVSFGDYAGVGPTGQVPGAGTTWLYITGETAVWRTADSDLFTAPLGQLLNRTANVVTAVMEREYVVTYDCFLAAIQVTLDSTAT